MRILIEEHQYSINEIRDVIHGIDALEDIDGCVSIHYVGYYYNSLLKDCVFILPKVLLKDVDGKELVFGKYRPEDIINLATDNTGYSLCHNGSKQATADQILRIPFP